MSGKSNNKATLKHIWPDIISGDEVRDPGVRFGIEDGMIALQSLRGKGYTDMTGKKILIHIMKNAMDYLSRQKCRAYVFMLDKMKYVFMIKGIEHKKRAEHQKNVVQAPDPQPEDILLPINDMIPHEWVQLMANRKARSRLIKEIIEGIIKYFHPPQGKMLIIDGGLLDDPEQPIVILSEASDDPNIDNASHCVWSFDRNVEIQKEMHSDEETHVTIKRNKDHETEHSILEIETLNVNCSERTIQYPRELKNRVGECDHCALFWIDYLSKDMYDPVTREEYYIDVLSRDTDFIPIMLSHHLEFLEYGCKTRIVMGKITKRKELFEDTIDIIWIERLYKNIMDRSEDSEVSFPHLCLSAVIMMSGNDYGNGYAGDHVFLFYKDIVLS